MTEEEKEDIMDFLKFYREEKDPKSYLVFIDWLNNEGREKVIDDIIEGCTRHRKTTVAFFSIQEYDFDGHLIDQWPKENKLELPKECKKKIGEMPLVVEYGGEYSKSLKADAAEYLINPLFIDSDDAGNIYVADYDGYKIVKFNACGQIVNIWKIDEKIDKLKDIKYNNFLDYVPSYNHGLAVKNGKIYFSIRRKISFNN